MTAGIRVDAGESEIRSKPPDERMAIRQARAGPLLESLPEWLRQTLGRVSKKSELAQVIGYPNLIVTGESWSSTQYRIL